MSERLTFSKEERLCNQTVIQHLYKSSGKTLVYPLSVHWIETQPCSGYAPLQVLIVVPKKKLHHAVDRNRMKRLIRECWRRRKNTLRDCLGEQNRSMAVSINYIHPATMDYHKLSQAFDKLMPRLLELTNND